jgi:hypothetical protein
MRALAAAAAAASRAPKNGRCVCDFFVFFSCVFQMLYTWWGRRTDGRGFLLIGIEGRRSMLNFVFCTASCVFYAGRGSCVMPVWFMSFFFWFCTVVGGARGLVYLSWGVVP